MSRLHFKGGAWSNAEDQVLKAALAEYGLRDWERVASMLTKKTATQCRERWESYLDPRLSLREQWSADEEEKLVELQSLFPNQWRLISEQLTRSTAAHRIRPAWLCEEHYQELRDQFDYYKQQAAAASSSSASAIEDSNHDGSSQRASLSLEKFLAARRRRRAPFRSHEEKSARADTVDGERYEKEMLEMAVSRLANQDQKKGMRKERQRQLEEASFLAKLENYREGVESNTLSQRQKKIVRKALQEDRHASGSGSAALEDNISEGENDGEDEEEEVDSDRASKGAEDASIDGASRPTHREPFAPIDYAAQEARAGVSKKQRVLLKDLTAQQAELARQQEESGAMPVHGVSVITGVNHALLGELVAQDAPRLHSRIAGAITPTSTATLSLMQSSDLRSVQNQGSHTRLYTSAAIADVHDAKQRTRIEEDSEDSKALGATLAARALYPQDMALLSSAATPPQLREAEQQGMTWSELASAPKAHISIDDIFADLPAVQVEEDENEKEEVYQVGTAVDEQPVATIDVQDEVKTNEEQDHGECVERRHSMSPQKEEHSSSDDAEQEELLLLPQQQQQQEDAQQKSLLLGDVGEEDEYVQRARQVIAIQMERLFFATTRPYFEQHRYRDDEHDTKHPREKAGEEESNTRSARRRRLDAANESSIDAVSATDVHEDEMQAAHALVEYARQHGALDALYADDVSTSTQTMGSIDSHRNTNACKQAYQEYDEHHDGMQDEDNDACVKAVRAAQAKRSLWGDVTVSSALHTVAAEVQSMTRTLQAERCAVAQRLSRMAGICFADPRDAFMRGFVHHGVYKQCTASVVDKHTMRGTNSNGSCSDNSHGNCNCTGVTEGVGDSLCRLEESTSRAAALVSYLWKYWSDQLERAEGKVEFLQRLRVMEQAEMYRRVSERRSALQHTCERERVLQEAYRDKQLQERQASLQ